MMLYDSDAVKMKYRVHKGILNLVKHISQLDEEDLANEVLQEQRKHSWPGLSKEAENIANDLDIDGLYDGHISKKEFKRKVRDAIEKCNDAEIKKDMESYKKMKIMEEETNKNNKFIKKEDISNGRILFRHRSEMYESKGNYKQRYKDTNLLCDSCESEVDDYLHVLYCSSYKELRDGKSLKNDTDLAIYLKKVLRIRTNLSLET